MANEEIKYALTANISNFSKNLKLAAGKVDHLERNIQQSMKSAQKSFKNAGLAIGIGMTAGVAAGVASLKKLQTEMSKAVSLANEQEDAEIKLAGVLRATGNAAGYSLDQLKAYAGELQGITTVGDEVTIAGMSILATFKEIKGDEFKEATKAAIDMSAVMGQDLKSSIVQVGKALNDPAKGMTALSRVGVSFTEEQKDLVKTLQESGDMAGAQKVILDELESEFGSVASALRGTFKGSVTAAQNALGDLGEEIGFAVTKNKLFIDVAKMLEQQFIKWTKSIHENKNAMMALAKDGLLLTIEGIGAAIEGVRFFYNGWKLVELAARGALHGIATGLEYGIKSIRFFLKPMDLLLSGLEKIGVVDSNPLKDFQNTMESFRSYTGDSLDGLLDGIVESEQKFDSAKEIVEDFKKRIEEIPVEYVDAAKNLENDNESIEQSVIKVGDQWGSVFDTAKQQSQNAAKSMIADAKKVQDAFDNSSSSYAKPDGFKTGGNPFFGGLGGYGGGDRRLIMVEDGEHIVRKEAVTAMGGHGFFNRLNNFIFPKVQGFKTGGPVGEFAFAGTGETVNINLSINGNTPLKLKGSRTTAQEMMKEFKSAMENSS